MSEMANGHERWSEELAAYLLGGLEPAEVEAFERHAADCERCRVEARWFAPAMQALPESVERMQAPLELRARVMAEVRADVAATAAGPAAASGSHSGAEADGNRTGRRSWRERLAGVGRGEGPRGLRPAVGLASLLLVVAAVAGYVVGNNGSSSPGGGPASTVVSGHSPGIVAEMVREGGGGALHLRNVRPIPDGKVLEAWVQRGGKVSPVPALFAPDREGRASTVVANMNGVETVMVTVEPSGGTRAPTSTPIVTLPIPQ
jgi:anti-sigma-K factor RskA